MKKIIIYVITVVLSILYIIFGNKYTTRNFNVNDSGSNKEIIKAEVTKVLEEEVVSLSSSDNSEHVYITFESKILSGKEKGKVVVAKQSIADISTSTTKKVEQGKKVLIMCEGEVDSVEVWTYIDQHRSDALIVLGAIFFALLLLFGKLKGVNTMISLVLTIASIFLVYVPSILSGYNAYISSIVTCVYIILSTLIIVYGANKKSLATCLGCFGGIIVSSILIVIMGKVLDLSGVVSEESMYLLYLNLDTPINLKAIVFGSILVGSIGAIMDVAIDISSSLMEVSSQMKDPSFNNILKSGLTIGKDIMGTMTNTLILAYIGSSLSTVLLLTAYNNSMLGLFNKEMIIVEVLQALIGSIGLLFTIPLTSFVCAILYSNKHMQYDVFEKIRSKHIIKK